MQQPIARALFLKLMLTSMNLGGCPSCSLLVVRVFPFRMLPPYCFFATTAAPSPLTAAICVPGLAGIISRTATAPIDRLKMILQVQEGRQGMSLRQGFQTILGEGTVPDSASLPLHLASCTGRQVDWQLISTGYFGYVWVSGSFKAFFRGNGTNVVKIGPETALKLSLNDSIRNRIVADPNNVQLQERMLSGALAGASAQVVPVPASLLQTGLGKMQNSDIYPESPY